MSTEPKYLSDAWAEDSWRKMVRKFNIHPKDLEHRLAVANNNHLAYGWIAAMGDNNPEAEDHPWRPTSK